jgi:3-hydroxybutyryl-CoA dehydrogenase
MVETICVCGAGTMGSGITQVAARAGYKTIQYDISDEMLIKSRNSILASLDSLVSKQKISAGDKTQIFGRIKFTSRISDCIADLFIEAIIERTEPKADLFNSLMSINPGNAIFATNTSSLPITEIQEKTLRPSMVAGMHFFNPAPVMKLVEIVKGKHTSEEVMNQLNDVCQRMDKVAVTCNDSPGFIVNRVARPYYLEALKLLRMNVASMEDIDIIMEASGFKMGPFKLMDLIGIDINYHVSDIVWTALGKPSRLEPSPLQKQKVTEGKLGKKTGEGFYKYKQD